MSKLHINVRRAFIGAGGAVALFGMANYHFEWGLFGAFGRQAMLFGFLVALLTSVFFFVHPDELRAYRDSKRQHIPD